MNRRNRISNFMSREHEENWWRSSETNTYQFNMDIREMLYMILMKREPTRHVHSHFHIIHNHCTIHGFEVTVRLISRALSAFMASRWAHSTHRRPMERLQYLEYLMSIYVHPYEVITYLTSKIQQAMLTVTSHMVLEVTMQVALTWHLPREIGCLLQELVDEDLLTLDTCAHILTVFTSCLPRSPCHDLPVTSRVNT